jgi:NAD(P)-dependent dehydrogenase (short-subunit alcohol dehydrogenase family)
VAVRSISELISLRGRVALVSGGAGHIGAAASHALAHLGASVAVIDHPAAPWARLAPEACALQLPIDLTDTTALRAAPSTVSGRLGRLDVLVNCAALVGTSDLKGWAVPFEEQSVESWRLALEVNLTAPFVLTQAAAPLLRASGHGSVVNVGSIYGVVGPDWSLYEGTTLSNPAAYGASKGGLIQLTRYLATTLAPGIRVNAVSPGGVLRGHTEPFLSRYERRTPLGRMATEEDMIGAIVFLASDLSAYVSGQNILVDGGWTAW